MNFYKPNPVILSHLDRSIFLNYLHDSLIFYKISLVINKYLIPKCYIFSETKYVEYKLDNNKVSNVIMYDINSKNLNGYNNNKVDAYLTFYDKPYIPSYLFYKNQYSYYSVKEEKLIVHLIKNKFPNIWKMDINNLMNKNPNSLQINLQNLLISLDKSGEYKFNIRVKLINDTTKEDQLIYISPPINKEITNTSTLSNIVFNNFKFDIIYNINILNSIKILLFINDTNVGSFESPISTFIQNLNNTTITPIKITNETDLLKLFSTNKINPILNFSLQ